LYVICLTILYLVFAHPQKWNSRRGVLNIVCIPSNTWKEHRGAHPLHVRIKAKTKQGTTLAFSQCFRNAFAILSLPIFRLLKRVLRIKLSRNFYKDKLHRSTRFCCWAAGGHFRSNFLRRIWIRGQNWPITSQDFEIFEVIYSKNGFLGYFWGYVQDAQNFLALFF